MRWILFVVSVVVAYAATKMSISVSFRHGLLDKPYPRSSHSELRPRIGGVGIFSSFYLSIAVLGVLGQLRFAEYTPFTRDILVMLLAGAGIAATGLIDR